MFPKQDDGSILGTGTPASTVTETMTLTDRVKCTVKGGEGSYAISVKFDEQTTGGAGVFDLTGVSVQNGLSSGNSNLYWLYQGFGFEGTTCTVNVDMRPATEDAPDGVFIEPGLAKFTFMCDPFTNTDGQACATEGTVFVRNCSK